MCSPSTSSSCEKNKETKSTSMNLSYKFTRQNYQELVWDVLNLIHAWRVFFGSYPDFIHVVWLQLPQGWPRNTQTHNLYIFSAVVVFFSCKIYAFSASYRKYTCRCLRWISPAPPPCKVFLGWALDCPWRVHRSPPRWASAPEPWQSVTHNNMMINKHKLKPFVL